MKRATVRLITAVSYVLFCVLVVGCVVFFCNGCTPYLSNEGYFAINYENGQAGTAVSISNIEQLTTGSTVPDGYKLIIQAEFKSGLVTSKCSERFMIEKVKEMCRKYGGDSFRLYDIIEPDMILNTCFKAKVLILRKE